jgi:hypothetical protein
MIPSSRMEKMNNALDEFEARLQGKSDYGAKTEILIYRMKNLLNRNITNEERRYIDANLQLMLRSFLYKK